MASRLLLALFLLIGVELPASAQTFPKLTGRVVDAANLTRDFESRDFLRDRGERRDAADQRTLVELLVDQIEFADVIVLNKVAAAGPGRAAAARPRRANGAGSLAPRAVRTSVLRPASDVRRLRQSPRSATIGSTRDARRAGTQLASTAAATSSAAAPPKAIGSIAGTP